MFTEAQRPVARTGLRRRRGLSRTCMACGVALGALLTVTAPGTASAAPSRWGLVTKVSQTPAGTGDGPSTLPSVSGDGSLVAFVSEATNLTATAQTGAHAYVKNLTTGVIQRVDPDDANRVVQRPLLSASGRTVVFVEGPSGPLGTTIYSRNLVTNKVSVVSQSNAGAVTDSAQAPSVSASGRYVAFIAPSLDPPFDFVFHVYLRDLALKTTTLVDRLPNGDPAGGFVRDPAISSDGRFIAFTTTAAVVAADTNQLPDIYVWDRTTGASSLAGPAGRAESTTLLAMSGNTSRMVTLVDDDGPNRRVEVRNRANWALLATLPADVPSWGGPSLSGNGNLLVYNAVDAILPRAFVRNLTTGRTFLADVPPNGGRPNSFSEFGAISGDGHTVVFDSVASNLAPADDLTPDVFAAKR